MLPFMPLENNSGLMRKVLITGIIEETKDARTFNIQPTEGDIPYRAGQFLTFAFQLHTIQERRSYSISSSPQWHEPLSVTVKRLPNGAFSRPLIEHGRVGDILTIAGGASGFFTLPDDEEFKSINRIIFIAAGSGITPVFSLIKTALKLHPQLPLVLIYSNTSRDKAIFREPLVELEKKHDSLTIEWLFSGDQDLLRTRLNKSLLKDLLNLYGGETRSSSLCYLCGPFDYMRMAAIVLLSEGIPSEYIKREVFTPEAPVSEALPPDLDKHQVEIHFQRKKYRLDVQYPDSILTVAKRQGIELPYSCEAGRCGSCVANCTKGNVWMKYNEVLTDREVARGRVLICNGYPVGGDVSIEFDS